MHYTERRSGKSGEEGSKANNYIQPPPPPHPHGVMVSVCDTDVADGVLCGSRARKAGHKQNPGAMMGPLSCIFQQLWP